MLTVANISRMADLDSHVMNVKAQNIVMDAAVILARRYNFLTAKTKVGLSRARYQNLGATGGQHAAHGVKTYIFGSGSKTKDIMQIYMRDGVDEVALAGPNTMLGLTTDVERRANLSIDKRLESNPQRVAQIQTAVDSTIGSLAEAREMACEFEFQRRFFEKGLLLSMRGAFGGDPHYDDMLSHYEATLAAPPSVDAEPAEMVDMIARLIED
jgi:hypothetical protein